MCNCKKIDCMGQCLGIKELFSETRQDEKAGQKKPRHPGFSFTGFLLFLDAVA
jgi:hypothetical protein